MGGQMKSELIEKIKNRKVLIMLSGGKDSCACLHFLKKQRLDVSAIHFVHEWGYQIVTDEAKRLCAELNIPLVIYDYSQLFQEALRGFKGGRPCLLCKEKMYELTLEYAIKEDIDIICIGDNANDTTTINRIKKHLVSRDDETLMFNTFMDLEITVPDGINIIRPIIDMSTEEVFQYLEKNKIKVQRVGDTGDKYFEYSREGCPIQFHDPGVEISVEDMKKLCEYNTVLSQFARDNSIRASIHIPSEFIVTIPRGYEKQARDYLLSNGIPLKQDKNAKNEKKYSYIILMKNIYSEIFQEEVTIYLCNRFFERLSMEFLYKGVSELGTSKIRSYEGDDFLCNICSFSELSIINIMLIANKKYEKEYMENLVIEIFRTNNFMLEISEI